MEEKLRRLEQLAVTTDSSVATKVFTEVCHSYAKQHGFDLLHDWMILSPAVVPQNIVSHLTDPHIIINSLPSVDIEKVLFLREHTVLHLTH